MSRTILTAFTVFIVVVILYFFGGEGLHSFAFAFLIGVVTGTYSTVYIAAPVVLWLSGESLDIPKESVAAESGPLKPACQLSQSLCFATPRHPLRSRQPFADCRRGRNPLTFTAPSTILSNRRRRHDEE